MKITAKWLRMHHACDFLLARSENKNLFNLNHREYIEALGDEIYELEWACFIIAHLLRSKKRKVRYALYVANGILLRWAKDHPNKNSFLLIVAAVKLYLRKTSISKIRFVANVADEQHIRNVDIDSIFWSLAMTVCSVDNENYFVNLTIENMLFVAPKYSNHAEALELLKKYVKIGLNLLAEEGK